MGALLDAVIALGSALMGSLSTYALAARRDNRVRARAELAAIRQSLVEATTRLTDLDRRLSDDERNHR